MPTSDQDPLGCLSDPVRAWFTTAFPGGTTPAQALAWPAISRGENLLLVAPTGTGKTLAAFLAIIDELLREHAAGTLAPGLRCVYVSPLRSLGYDIERNLAGPLNSIGGRLGTPDSPVQVGVRTGDTSAQQRKSLRTDPPHLLITTPESLSLLLSQSNWDEHWKGVRHLIVDEIHALVPTKRGADLAVSLERLSARARQDPQRIGLSATCRPAAPVARFLTGPSRLCRIAEATAPPGAPPLELRVESLLRADEAPHRGLTYHRLLKRLGQVLRTNRTTIVFANTRAFTEKITHDLRQTLGEDTDSVAAHHSALDAERRHHVESALKDGRLNAVVTSTSLELGVDIGTADLAVQIGLPGGVSRCLQRVGRSGHRLDAPTRGLLLAATAAELAGALVTAEAARAGAVEPLRPVSAPLDVVCQQLIGMACAGDWDADAAFALLRRTEPMAQLLRADFDDCLAFLAGELAAPAGAFEPEPGATPRWTSPRLWKHRGRFGLRSRRIARWFWGNVGTINSEESVRVIADGVPIGTLEGAYAERLQKGDRFVLDGRSLEFRRIEGLIVHARPSGGKPTLPRWSSDRQGLSAELALALARFREELARRQSEDPSALRAWLSNSHAISRDAAESLTQLFESQERFSEVPRADTLLIEESPHEQGYAYTFHAPLSRSACEALGRATAARLGRRFGRDLALNVADLGWTIRLTDGARLEPSDLAPLLTLDHFDADVLDGLDRGDLLARRFRHVAANALMVLRNPDGGRRKVGGLLWVSQRLYPLVKAATPDHPLLRETRREVLHDLLDAPSARAWLERSPTLRFRMLPELSPFAAAWIVPADSEPLRFESPADALKRLHARLVTTGAAP
ncbi:MAG: DEAD/DEAH box helicase [Isosphaeraceae bacterium]|nr:DEAD/DEAH box helicase [Isosphaeraceae bacterium]